MKKKGNTQTPEDPDDPAAARFALLEIDGLEGKAEPSQPKASEEGPSAAAGPLAALEQAVTKAFENARAGLAALKQDLRSYEDGRKRLFRECLEKDGQEWCSWGQHAVPKTTTNLVGYCSNGWSFHRICHTCLSAHSLNRQAEPKELTPLYKRDGRYYEEGQSEPIGTFYTPTDWTEPSSVPTAAIEAFGLPPKLILWIEASPPHDEEHLHLVRKQDESRDNYSFTTDE